MWLSANRDHLLIKVVTNEVYVYTELLPEKNEEQGTEEDAPSLPSEVS